MIYKLLHTYIPQCLLICDLAQLLPTRYLHPYSVMFYGSADKEVKVAGHQAKGTVDLELVVKRDETKTKV